ncbi:snapalysin family zinc-dependent metalloprotease [Streptomyces sp. NPDC057099]|uniref:snapalysin family zinc-dependent metalloprotease n=1 Tax=Streptomyces sp. NPDC057099 TaxID=3346019 RepID=UPI00363BAD4D
MKLPKLALATALGVGLLASGLSIASASPDASGDGSGQPAATDLYTTGKDDKADTDAFIQAVLKSALAKKENAGNATKSADAAVTVTYSTKEAPHFRKQIKRSAAIWNAALDNVELKEGSNPDFIYREGDDSRGSYATGQGKGKGLVFLDFTQNKEFNSTRITSHETGHILGLPDRRTGQCSDLMSGGSAPADCDNAKPSAEEADEVDRQWAQGQDEWDQWLAAADR